MTDREKLLRILDMYDMDYLETIINCYFMEYEDDFSASRINNLIKDLTFRLKHKISHLEEKHIAQPVKKLVILNHILMVLCGKMKKVLRQIYNRKLRMLKQL